jgi:hypothetical protein
MMNEIGDCCVNDRSFGFLYYSLRDIMEEKRTVTFLWWLSQFPKELFHRKVCPNDRKVRVGGVFPLGAGRPP